MSILVPTKVERLSTHSVRKDMLNNANQEPRSYVQNGNYVIYKAAFASL